MKKIFKKKSVIIILIAILAVPVIIALNKNKGPVEVFVNAVSLEKKSIEQTISVKAPLEGIEKVDVVSPLNYEIIDIKVKEGDVVLKDQVLAELDSEELKEQITSEENRIALAQLELQDRLKAMQIEYDKALLRVKELEDSYKINMELLENEIITQESFDKIKSSLSEAKKGLESYNAVDGKIVSSPSEAKRIEIQKQELEKKKKDLDKVFIKSPIDGTITRVNVNLGRYARDTEGEKAMFVVENLSKLQMKVSISEYDIEKVHIGQEVEIYSDVLKDGVARGVVARISPTAEQKDNNAMERVIPVVIDVTERPGNLIAGVIASAKIKVDKAENVFVVPSGALLQDENNNLKLFTLNEDNTLKSVTVEAGIETELETVIDGSELTEGMDIVVNPDMSYTDGMTVTPNKETEQVNYE
ncbi:efflux RND transporter periplasmic adaptor subunit [Sedimentibacter sp.]|uniref:efflux RND transporter periplasmic adaptor subunit n=1 Tax=Sedimentibacter sp. TaxID=1960295 RepID=UPI00289933A5|nr:HlyD family efflux transporter periplasmic adaptor subunit [Sedimentibacter sp.]